MMVVMVIMGSGLWVIMMVLQVCTDDGGDGDYG